MSEQRALVALGALCGLLVKKDLLTLAEMRTVLGEFAPTDDELVANAKRLGLVASEDEARRVIEVHS